VSSADANANSSSDDNSGAGYAIDVPDASGDGTSDNPFFICASALPVAYTDDEDTSLSSQSLIDNYPPAAQNEDGPEYIYTFTLQAPATFSGTVSNGTGVDIDIHLLQAIDPPTLFANSATSRADTTLSNIALPAGTYWLSLDTFGTDDSKAGPYTLSVSLAAAP
jgi:hypothetical protein